jgi:hypothetical protein
VATTTAAAGGPENSLATVTTSAPATFVTALLDGWSPSAKFISLQPSCVQSGALPPQVNCSFYGYFRKEITVPAAVVSASAFITAQNWGIFDNQLSNYKLSINGKLVGLGPGRGEAAVWGGPGETTLVAGKFHSLPYNTLDLTSHLPPGGRAVLAIEALHHGGPAGPQPLMQLNLLLTSGKTVEVVTDGSWDAFDGDVHRRPGPAKHGDSAGTVRVFRQEFTLEDAIGSHACSLEALACV